MKAIFACDPCGGIGYKGKIPWEPLDGDLARFRELTMGQTVIMGRKTWESLPDNVRPLPGRHNVVISRSGASFPGAQTYEKITDVPGYEKAWFIGGAELLQDNMPLITELHLSKVHDIHRCDRFIDLQFFRLHFDVVDVDHSCNGYNYSIWQRNDAPLDDYWADIRSSMNQVDDSDEDEQERA